MATCRSSSVSGRSSFAGNVISLRSSRSDSQAGKTSALALGHGSLYNHSDESNAFVEMEDSTNLLYFYALKKIKAGEEITIDYGYSKKDREKFGIR